MFLVDLEKGRIIDDKELKDSLASAKPYAEWIERSGGVCSVSRMR